MSKIFVNTSMKWLEVATTLIILANVQRIGYGHKSSCGKRLVNHKGLITNGFSTKEGDWPWHAAIDHLIKHTFEYKCGGTVLNSKIILTAGHCVYENHRPIIPERVRVQLGLYNLRFPGTNTDQYQVYEITPHPRFNPKTLVNDIAIIRLSTEATLNNYVQPICLWDSSKVASSQVEGKIGTVIGWGYTEKSDISAILREAHMPVVRSKMCLDSNPEFYGPYLTNTSFCGGFRNGTSVCSGDSGGSMAFEVDGVYRIRGIVSLSQSKNDKPLCNSEEFVVFTDVAKYLTWIDESKSTSSESDVHRNGYGGKGIKSSCGKRSVNHKELLTNAFSSKEGDWPWHATIEHLIRDVFQYKCGGTVLNSKTVLTAGHCVYEDYRKIIPERVKVRLGLYSLLFSTTNAQEFEVFEIIAHPGFNATTLDNDIAIIRLSTKATLNKYVQPICLWDSSKVALSEVIGKTGTVIVWENSETDTTRVILRHAYMPVVKQAACLNSNPEFYGPFITDKTFCAGFRNGTSICAGDSGGSMTFEVDGVYRIRGIVSLSQWSNNTQLCNSEDYVIFTDVGKYVTWIDEFITNNSTSSESGLKNNGSSSKEGDWPWHAAIDHLIKSAFEYRCGGTVLNSETILTAGHCVYEDDRPIVPERVKVQLGLYNLRLPGKNTQQFEVFKIIPHPKFNAKTLANNIAIIRLSTEATLNNYVQPIPLWDSTNVALSEIEGKYGIAIGWRRTEIDDISEVLRQVQIPVVTRTACLTSYIEYIDRFLEDKLFCAGFQSGTSICSGFGGGSMVFEVDGVYRIRGILSFRQSKYNTVLCNSEEYVVFTDVAKYLTWIEVSMRVCPENKNEVHPDCSCANNYIYDADEFICVRRCPDDAIQVQRNCLCKSKCKTFYIDSWSCLDRCSYSNGFSGNVSLLLSAIG